MNNFRPGPNEINQRVEMFFGKYDKNNDGRLDKSESVFFLNEFFQSLGRNIDKDFLDRVLYNIDSNRDGFISKEELRNSLMNAYK